MAIFGLAAETAARKVDSGVGQADQAGVRDQLQPQPDPALYALLSGHGEAGGLVDRPLEVDVAEAAVAAFAQAQTRAGLVQVGDQGLVVLFQHLGADGDLQHHVLTAEPAALAAHAVDAGAGLEVLLVAVVDQGVQPLDRLDPDVATPSTVAAVWTAVLDELLTPERHGSPAAVARAHEDFALVEEFHRRDTGFRRLRVRRPD